MPYVNPEKKREYMKEYMQKRREQLKIGEDEGTRPFEIKPTVQTQLIPVSEDRLNQAEAQLEREATIEAINELRGYVDIEAKPTWNFGWGKPSKADIKESIKREILANIHLRRQQRRIQQEANERANEVEQAREQTWLKQLREQYNIDEYEEDEATNNTE